MALQVQALCILMRRSSPWMNRGPSASQRKTHSHLVSSSPILLPGIHFLQSLDLSGIKISDEDMERLCEVYKNIVVYSHVKVDDEVSSVVYSPDGSKLAAAHWTSVSIFNVETGEVQCTVKGCDVTAVAWSPCGQWLASGGDDRMIFIYDAKTFEFKSSLNVGYAPFSTLCGDLTAL